MRGSPLIKELFNDLLELPDDARQAYLDEKCGSDVAVRERVAALLRAHQTAGGMLSDPTVAVAVPGDTPVGASIGPYKLLERIGEGGFGTVYMAEQREPVQRRVALKVVKPGMDSRQVIARFEAERQALAMMDHPNIARVLEAGATDAQSSLGPGRPYFVMELVRGVPITKFCDENNLTIRQRLGLAIDVCHAVQHAHMKGVIHRDLKPSNVLVTMHDDKPVPKVIDFGIAKATQGRLTEKTLFTEFRQLIGTPAYMSPEQAQMSGIDIDTRSDIYSLGVLLYELLTGTTPFDSKTLMEAGYDELRRIIREVEPPRPSTRLSSLSGAGTRARRHEGTKEDDPGAASPAGTGSSDSSSADVIAGHRHTDAPTLRRQLCGELDWIVMKCLEKDRTRRYETANGLAADIAHHLSGEPVHAAPPSKVYRLRKTLHRNRVPVAFAATIALLLIGATAVSLFLLHQSRANAAAAERQVEETELAATLLADIIGKTEIGRNEPDEKPVPDEVMRQRLDNFATSFEPKLAGHPEVEARVRLALGNAYRSIGELDRAEPHQARALSLCRELYGPEHPKVATALYEWARLLHDKKDDVGAEATHREALAMRRRLLGDVHLDVSYSLDSLGDILCRQSRFAESEAALRESLAIVEKLYGPEHREATGTLDLLLGTLEDEGRIDEAEAVGRRLLALHEKIYGAEHARSAKERLHLGRVLARHGRGNEGVALLREGVKILERVNPHGDAQLTLAQHQVADILRGLGHTDEAEVLARRAVGWYRENARSDSAAPRSLLAERSCALQVLVAILSEQQKVAELDALVSELTEIVDQCAEGDPTEAYKPLTRLAWCLHAQGKHTESLKRYQAALELIQRIHTGDDPEVAASLSNLAFTLTSLGRPQEALPLYRAALEMQQRLFKGDRAEVATTLDNWAACFKSAGRLDEALSKFVAALEMRQRLYEGDHPDVARNLNNVAWILEQLGRSEDALLKYQAALEMRRRLFPGDHATVALDLDNLANCLVNVGRSQEALPKFEAALEMRQRLFPGDHPDVASSLNHVGHCLQMSLGRPADALPKFQAALEMFQRLHNGGDDPEVAGGLHNVAFSLHSHGRTAEALALARRAVEMYRRIPNQHATFPDALELYAGLLQGDGQLAEAESVRREHLELLRTTQPEGHPDLERALGPLGVLLLAERKYAEAEPILRECLPLRETRHGPDSPQHWLVFQTRGMLGEALLGQAEQQLQTDRPAALARLREAEPLIVESSQWLTAGIERINPALPLDVRMKRFREASERPVRLYETWDRIEPNAGYAEKAAEWRTRLDANDETPTSGPAP